MRSLALDHVLFIPTSIPPHKDPVQGASTEQRVRFLQLALQTQPNFSMDPMELQREGKSYTVDTLSELKQRFPEAELFFLMGSDMLRSFLSWRAPAQIARLATLVCIRRFGQSGDEQEMSEMLQITLNAKILLLDGVSDLSSTDVRDRLFSALPITGMVPEEVELALLEECAYQPPQIVALHTKLREQLSSHRMRHTAGVWKTASELAQRYGADPAKARLAALLHDCAKELPTTELMKRTQASDPILPVLHAEVGAQLAESDYGVSDAEILQAIRLHTTGDANMTVLDKIIYLADMIEPYRDFPGVAELRRQAKVSLDDAVLLALLKSLWYIETRQGRIHDATLRAVADLGGTYGTTVR